ncbi:unnamed protein product [Rotaria socialis]|uniref:GTP-binding protein n=5 Tax=Rotaria socialis TaxID=392032 RepID=A0A819Y3K8_9BILA|nr:unnamed protein product [Rotaria socialis]CAF3475169.1 unnamed protein product [Rotaria socialis]CAF3722861.1 unnamed protein product [Rotaria socialis]CAF4152209.1 unnamed protein product [Rotaria socialis]
MNYGVSGVFDTATNNSLNTVGDYPHTFQSHYHPHSRPYSNGFHNSLRFNSQNRLDDNDDNQQQSQQQQYQQRIDGDYETDDINKSKLLMWGLTKSGKTSIIKLIFEKMSAGETLKLPETKMVQIHELTCGIYVKFQIRDVPGPKMSSLNDFEAFASNSTTIVFVLDITEDYSDAINLLVSSVQWMHQHGHNVRFEVLIHKIDGVHEPDRLERYSTIQKQVSVMLHECSIEKPMINFYLTSIYDHSIHEAFSKIVQNQMKQLRALENMLNLVTESTQLDKIFVCDIYNKIFLASDTKPVDTQLSELCCDVVDVYTGISSIYGTSNNSLLDSMSFCTIELSIGLILYLKDIDPTTALICILKKESKINEALMEVNLNILKKNIQELFLMFAKNSTRQQLNTSITSIE